MIIHRLMRGMFVFIGLSLAVADLTVAQTAPADPTSVTQTQTAQLYAALR